jgi:hypothetical protein
MPATAGAAGRLSATTADNPVTHPPHTDTDPAMAAGWAALDDDALVGTYAQCAGSVIERAQLMDRQSAEQRAQARLGLRRSACADPVGLRRSACAGRPAPVGLRRSGRPAPIGWVDVSVVRRLRLLSLCNGCRRRRWMRCRSRS